MPGAAGVILLEATRQAYARIRPGGAVAPALSRAPALQPQPATRATGGSARRNLMGSDLAAARKRP
jgi:hypothetical protein